MTDQFQTLRQTLQAIRALGLSARITPYDEVRIAPIMRDKDLAEECAYYGDIRDADGRRDAIATAEAMAKAMRPRCGNRNPRDDGTVRVPASLFP